VVHPVKNRRRPSGKRLTVELQAEDGHAHKIEEHGMVGAAADAGVGEVRVGDFGGWIGLAPLARG